ncbi:MAG: NAD(P)/FAD-dependent oxidoreductase [Rhodothermales bacterium]|nr:NAD(P)/FAD-dependent oxidoreductase [Rhodothermales bacterium]
MGSPSIIIVGAGPAGLAVGARLRKMGIDFDMVEQGTSVAPSWHNHYERLHLHTVKEYSSLPFMPFPSGYPTYVSRQQLTDYLIDYASEFEISPRFNTQVQSVERAADKWILSTTGEKMSADRVVLATGINRVPLTPSWPGLDSFTGTVVHSRDYRTANPFENKRCLVVGMGNTGAEIALDLAESGIAVAISVRGPVNIVPRDAFGRPTQQTAIHLSGLPLWLQDALAKLTQKLTIGNLSKFGLRTPSIAPTAQLRRFGKTPVIDLGTVKQIREGNIVIRPEIKRFTQAGVEFADGRVDDFDAVIICTGYKSGVTDIFPAVAPYTDEYGNPTIVIGKESVDGAYFIGFDNYRAGGVLGIINTDSKIIADHLGGV